METTERAYERKNFAKYQTANTGIYCLPWTKEELEIFLEGIIGVKSINEGGKLSEAYICEGRGGELGIFMLLRNGTWEFMGSTTVRNVIQDPILALNLEEIDTDTLSGIKEKYLKGIRYKNINHLRRQNKVFQVEWANHYSMGDFFTHIRSALMNRYLLEGINESNTGLSQMLDNAHNEKFISYIASEEYYCDILRSKTPQTLDFWNKKTKSVLTGMNE